jgi:DNA-binding NarL/FixJ family response regulator
MPVAARHQHLAARQRSDEAPTRRECVILAVLAEGLTDRGIGERLWLTPKTVQTHIRHLLAKLDLPSGPQHNRRVLAALAFIRAGGSI